MQVAQDLDIDASLLGRWVKSSKSAEKDSLTEVTADERAELLKTPQGIQDSSDGAGLPGKGFGLPPCEIEAFDLIAAEKANFPVNLNVSCAQGFA